MGDESKTTEVDKGHHKPLDGPVKPSTADAVDPRPADTASLPDPDEVDRRRPQHEPPQRGRT